VVPITIITVKFIIIIVALPAFLFIFIILIFPFTIPFLILEFQLIFQNWRVFYDILIQIILIL